MKKTLVTLLVLTFAVFAFACGGDAPNANANKPANVNKPATPAPTVAAPVNNNTAPANGNSNKPATAVTQGKTVDDKSKEKADTAAPAASPKKP